MRLYKESTEFTEIFLRQILSFVVIVYRHTRCVIVISHHTSMHVYIYACTLAVGSAPLNTLVLWSSYHRDIKLFGAFFSSFPFPFFCPIPHPPPLSSFTLLILFLSYNFAAVSSDYAD